MCVEKASMGGHVQVHPQKKPLILFEMNHQHGANGGELGRKPLVKCVEASVYILTHISRDVCDESRVFI